MSTDRGPRVTRGDAERLLDGVRGRATGTARLFDLLTAASAIPADGQAAVGEQSALAAFREARRHAKLSPRRHRMLKTALANVVAGKIAAATATAAAMGGVSLAAATGHLPGPFQDVAHSAFGAPAASGNGAPGQSHGGSAHRGGVAETSESAPAPQESVASSAPENDETTASVPSSTAASLHPSLTGLCTAYQAHEVRQARGHANPNADKYLNSRAFSVLVTAAGGTDGVQDYCTALIGPAPTRPTHTTPSHPSSSDHPSRPTHSAPSHPSSSDHPSRPTHSAPSHPSSSDHPSRPTHTPPSHPDRSDRPTHPNRSHPAPPAHGGGSSHAHGRP